MMRNLFFAAALLSLSLSAGERLVANPSFAAPESHAPQQVMGRDYWTLLRALWYANPAVELTGQWQNPELINLPLFRDCALRSRGCIGRPPEGKAAWPTIKENYNTPANSWWDALETCPKLDKPLIVSFSSKRSVLSMSGEIELDQADYENWKRRHPNLVAFATLDEWGNEIVLMEPRVPQIKDPVTREKISKEWLPLPTERYEMLQYARRYFDRKAALHYNDRQYLSTLRHVTSLDHVAAAWGAKLIFVEVTNTSSPPWEYRWQISPMFTRGAARQFKIPWGWYTANYYNGYTEGGEWMNNSTRFYMLGTERRTGPDCGISGSLYNRGNYLGFFSGANYLEPENWYVSLLQTSKGDVPRVELSPWGRQFSALHDFTLKHPDRGTPYTPVAILTPFAQAYPAHGGKPWRITKDYLPGDYMIDAFFFTIAPGFDRASAMRQGVEGNLHNSPFALMYDVLVPDSPQSQADFVKALCAYPVAVLAGSYQPGTDLETPLRQYVRDGGTLLLNAAYLPDFFKPDFTGVEVSGETLPCGGKAVDDLGREFAIDAEYQAAGLLTKGAKVILRDSDGRTMATSFPHGKGKVIVSAPLWLTPVMTEQSLSRVPTGQQKFVFVDYFLRRLQDELFPVSVDGDIMCGINKRKDGWLLWLMNNKGIIKFADTPEKIIPGHSAAVSVDLKSQKALKVMELLGDKQIPIADGSFRLVVEPGEIAVLHIEL